MRTAVPLKVSTHLSLSLLTLFGRSAGTGGARGNGLGFCLTDDRLYEAASEETETDNRHFCWSGRNAPFTDSSCNEACTHGGLH
jgi:hypothetical protein